MVQKEGCWVRQTERWIIGTREEMGPCQRPAQAWSDEPVIRAVQECVAQADYRWQARALDAWSQGAPMPDRAGTDDGVLEGCLSGPLREALGRNEALRAQLDHALEDRSTLNQQTREDRLFLQSSHERIATSLGEAALKPPGSATATAHSTSEGVARVSGALNASSEQREVASQPAPQSEGRGSPDRGAPLELMRRDDPGAPTPPPVIPVDSARPPVPAREASTDRPVPARAASSDHLGNEVDATDLWESLEPREGAWGGSAHAPGGGVAPGPSGPAQEGGASGPARSGEPSAVQDAPPLPHPGAPENAQTELLPASERDPDRGATGPGVGGSGGGAPPREGARSASPGGGEGEPGCPIAH